MTSKIDFSPEEVSEDRIKFLKEYPGESGQVQKDPTIDLDKLARRWYLMMQTQNGDAFDDYGLSADSNKVCNYLGTWVPEDSDALLMGVGTGREVAMARGNGYNAVGTTLGKSNPTFAKWKFEYNDKDIFYGDNCTLPYGNGVFDVAMGLQLFEHVHAPYMFLTECARVLKPGGQLILEWPPYISTNNGTLEVDESPSPSNFMSEYDDDNLHHTCCWTPAQGCILVRRCGFEDVEVYLKNYRSQEVPVHSNDPVPAGLVRIDDKDPGWFSNISPSDIVVRAKRRPDHRLPHLIKRLMEADTLKLW